MSDAQPAAPRPDDRAPLVGVAVGGVRYTVWVDDRGEPVWIAIFSTDPARAFPLRMIEQASADEWMQAARAARAFLRQAAMPADAYPFDTAADAADAPPSGRM